MGAYGATPLLSPKMTLRVVCGSHYLKRIQSLSCESFAVLKQRVLEEQRSLLCLQLYCYHFLSRPVAPCTCLLPRIESRRDQYTPVSIKLPLIITTFPQNCEISISSGSLASESLPHIAGLIKTTENSEGHRVCTLGVCIWSFDVTQSSWSGRAEIVKGLCKYSVSSV